MLCPGTQGEAGGEGEGLFQRVWLLDVVILEEAVPEVILLFFGGIM